MERQIWPLIRPEVKEDDLREKASAKEQVLIYS
jgi:hypothetical protein